jgi:protein disulfide-isomerase
MTRLTKVFFIALGLLLLAGQNLQAQTVKDGLTWYTDVNKAYDASKKSKKPIFAFFTGSDWCGWCHKLEAAVFHKPGFQQWAKQNVILLELDFPRRTQQPQELAQQNAQLQQAFGVQGYPTIWMFNLDKDKAGKFNIAALGSLGYPDGPRGQEESIFLANANKILANKK